MSNEAPTDALRLVRELAAKGADTPGCNNWRSASMCRQIVEVLDKAAPASPLPEGGVDRNALIDVIAEAAGWGVSSGYIKAERTADAVMAFLALTRRPDR